MRRSVAILVGVLGVVLFLVCALPRVAARGIVRPYRRSDESRATPAAWAAVRAAGIDPRPLDFLGEGDVPLSS
ncbi:MAG: hypothetical protein HYR85_27540 [Planctomycetes bacterium]|nr:hypothetical protein [Planctomycetota bacterium]MBI3844266.1 hypothetical protein [Planctomycetota bacterium]